MTSIAVKDANNATTTITLTAPGTAGAASADVLSIQGITGMTPLKTDGSGVTQPVSTVSASAVVAQKIAVGTTAAAATAAALINGVLIKADANNTATIYVGPSGVTTSTGFPLAAGQTVFAQVANASALFFVSGSASQSVNIFGS